MTVEDTGRNGSAPLADIHVHQERSPRLDRVLARRGERVAVDWHAWMNRMTAETPPGVPRLRRLQRHLPAPLTADSDPEIVVQRIEDLLTEAASDGAVLVEPRFGNETVLAPGFVDLLWDAIRRTRDCYPALCVAPVINVMPWRGEQELVALVDLCMREAAAGRISGIDLLSEPYDGEAEWGAANAFAASVANAGLGVTVHAGEFSTANIAAALRVPGVTRIGHATQAVRAPELLETLAASGVTVECCLTSNLLLGAVTDLRQHPLLRFLELGIPVALGTDDPVQFSTTIRREYELTRKLGLSSSQIGAITRNAVEGSFVSDHERSELLTLLDTRGSLGRD